MYRDFHAVDRWTKREVHCLYQCLIVAIATRHADAVDVKFLVDGRPVWVALRHVSEWRWMTGRTDSPWYPTMRLFRCPEGDDWTALLGAIADEIARKFCG